MSHQNKWGYWGYNCKGWCSVASLEKHLESLRKVQRRQRGSWRREKSLEKDRDPSSSSSFSVSRPSAAKRKHSKMPLEKGKADAEDEPFGKG